MPPYYEAANEPESNHHAAPVAGDAAPPVNPYADLPYWWDPYRNIPLSASREENRSHKGKEMMPGDGGGVSANGYGAESALAKVVEGMREVAAAGVLA